MFVYIKDAQISSRNTVEPLWKAREVPVKLQNLVYFHAPFFTFIMFTLPLLTGHLFWKATILGGLYRGVPLYMYTEHGYCFMCQYMATRENISGFYFIANGKL